MIDACLMVLEFHARSGCLGSSAQRGPVENRTRVSQVRRDSRGTKACSLCLLVVTQTHEDGHEAGRASGLPWVSKGTLHVPPGTSLGVCGSPDCRVETLGSVTAAVSAGAGSLVPPRRGNAVLSRPRAVRQGEPRAAHRGRRGAGPAERRHAAGRGFRHHRHPQPDEEHVPGGRRAHDQQQGREARDHHCPGEGAAGRGGRAAGGPRTLTHLLLLQ